MENKKTPTQRIKGLLHVLDFTPKTLSKAIGVSEYKARRILSIDGELHLGEVKQILKIVQDTDAHLLLNGADEYTNAKGA